MQHATRMLHNHRVGLEAGACAAFRSQDDNTETMWLWVGQELASQPTKCAEWALYCLLDCSMTVKMLQAIEPHSKLTPALHMTSKADLMNTPVWVAICCCRREQVHCCEPHVLACGHKHDGRLVWRGVCEDG
jgi:hypothetical protein